MNRGYVYIISNESLYNMLKVGYTLDTPEIRARELYTTGIPTKYIVEYWILVNNPYLVEQAVHKKLEKYNCGKEWFKCDFQTCYQAIIKSCSANFYDEYIKRDEYKYLSKNIIEYEKRRAIKKEQEDIIKRREAAIIKKREIEQNKLEKKLRFDEYQRQKRRNDKEFILHIFISSIITIILTSILSDKTFNILLANVLFIPVMAVTAWIMQWIIDNYPHIFN